MKSDVFPLYWFWIAVAVIYLFLNVYMIRAVSSRQPAETPVAARDLPRNHQIADGDLTTNALSGLVGRYLTREVKAGDDVSDALLQAQPLQPTLAPTLAAVVTAPASDVEDLALASGATADICLGGGKSSAANEIIRIDCDAAFCSVLLKVTHVADLEPARALAQATLGNLLRPCP